MDEMRHIHLKEPDLRVNIERNTYEVVKAICAETVDMENDAIVQACIRCAKEAGITDLFLIDRKFVEDALIEKATRDKLVRCMECKYRGDTYKCPMRRLVLPLDGAGHYEDFTEDDGYCHRGERRVQ
jgi:hypothetical protein